MPTYAYTCTACQHSLEVRQSFTDDALTECPECQGRLRKRFDNVGVVFKGSGFYRNDSRAAEGSGKNGKSSSSSSEGSSSSKDSGDKGGSKDSSGSKDSGGGSSSGDKSSSSSSSEKTSSASASSSGSASKPSGGSSSS